jgi:hypothetical protein
MQVNKNQLHKEAEIFGRYIIGVKVNKNTIEQYVNSFEASPMIIAEKEQLLIDKCVKNKRLLPYYDGALSLKNQNHLLKQKLLRMFAILETRPEYSDKFLGKEFPKGYIFKIGLVGIRGVFRAIIGLIILPRTR